MKTKDFIKSVMKKEERGQGVLSTAKRPITSADYQHVTVFLTEDQENPLKTELQWYILRRTEPSIVGNGIIILCVLTIT